MNSGGCPGNLKSVTCVASASFANEINSSETQLIAWIERNFENVDAVREVVANLKFFGPDAATFSNIA